MGIDKEMLEAMRTIISENNQTLKQQLRDEMSHMMDTKLEAHDERLINQVNAIIESKVMPQIQLVAEQHGEIIRKLDKAAEVDGLKDRIMTLERVALKTTDEIDKLKKAQ